MKTPRINKTKEQISADIKQAEKVKHIKQVVRDIFPKLQNVDSIYDAQTVLGALQGFIKVELEAKLDAIKLSDLHLDFKDEKDSKIKEAMVDIVRYMADEPADEFSQTAERLSRAFGDFGAQKFLKNPMSEINLDDLLAS